MYLLAGEMISFAELLLTFLIICKTIDILFRGHFDLPRLYAYTIYTYDFLIKHFTNNCSKGHLI